MVNSILIFWMDWWMKDKRKPPGENKSLGGFPNAGLIWDVVLICMYYYFEHINSPFASLIDGLLIRMYSITQNLKDGLIWTKFAFWNKFC